MIKRVVIIFLVLSLSSCEKILFEPDLATNDPLEIFDYMWSEVDRKYSYFELKNIDWNQMRNTYRPMLSANSNDIELFDVLAAMLNELRDDHTNLVSSFNVSQYNVALRSPENYNGRTIEEYYYTNHWRTGSLINDYLSNGEVGYIRYGSFSSGF